MLFYLIPQVGRIHLCLDQRKGEGCDDVCNKALRADEIREASGELMDTVSTGDVLVLVSYPVARVAFGLVVTGPVQEREGERGVNAELIGVGPLSVSRLPVAQ